MQAIPAPAPLRPLTRATAETTERPRAQIREGTATGAHELVSAAEFCRQLSQAVGPHRFGLWFEHGTTFTISATSVEIVAANSCVRDWIVKHFRGQVDGVTTALLGPDAVCDVTVVAAQAQDHGMELTRASAELPIDEPRAAARVVGKFGSGRSAATEPRGEDSRRAPREQSGLSAASDDARRRSAPAPNARGQYYRRLEDFVVGESNRLAFAASQQIGEGSREAPSILFIHGECGVGKTHLIQGICRRRAERSPRQIIKYVTGEQFTNEYIASVRDGSLEGFRKRLRRVDLLAIDDVHFLANKTATQAEFLHTIDAIGFCGSRLALVSDEHPHHIRRFSQSLVSRFLSGMIVKVDRPDRGTRIELVRRLARERGLDLTTAGEEAVAGRCTGSIREVEGAITRLGALVELDGARGQIGPGTVERLFGEERPTSVGGAPIRLVVILESVCDRLRVTREELLGNGRHARTVVARGLVAHLARELTTHSYPEIARSLGRNTHSAVHTAAKRLRLMIDSDEKVAPGGDSVREVVDQLRHDIARTNRVKSA